MDAKQTGRFIADLRKEKGFTQEELAQELNVTNKAVSRWETGAGFPDVDSMMALSAFFGVTLNELLLGRRNPPPEQPIDASAAEELKKKEDAEIACAGLDLSVKKRRSQRVIKIMAAALAAVILASCTMLYLILRPKPQGDPFADNALWFCTYRSSPQMLSPAKVINISTGEVFAACPVPNCDHARSDENCFYNYSKDHTCVLCAEYAEGHMVFIASKDDGTGESMKLYDFSMREKKLKEVYAFKIRGSDARIFTNGQRFFFTATLEDKQGGTGIGILGYDPKTGVVTVIDMKAGNEYATGWFAFYEDHYITGMAVDKEGERLYYCRRTYENANEEIFNSLPDGTPLETYGWRLESDGLFANTWGSGGVYIEKTNTRLMFPTDSATTSPVEQGGRFYFQTRSSERSILGKNPFTQEACIGYTYDNELYVMERDGAYRHYSIDCKYRFVTVAAYGNIIMGRIKYYIPKPGICISETFGDYKLPDIIRIDLETGETTVYDTSKRSDYVVDTFISRITHN